MATVNEILAAQAYDVAVDEAWAKDNNYPSYTMYAEPEYVPVTNKRIADFNSQVSVRGEQNAQYVGFQLPRYDDATDLTAKNLYIHYQTVYGGSDSVPCNVSKSENHVRICWKIPAQATQEPGTIQMMIYATGTDSAGERTIWKTLPASYPIHDGLEIGGGIPEPDPSWYEQFVAQMESRVSTAQGYANDAQASKTAASGSATAAAESAVDAEKTLQDTKDYIDLKKSEFIGYSKRASDIKYANAIIGSATGTTQVTVSDAWEAPIPGLEIAGRSEQVVTTGAQLLDLTTKIGPQEKNGVTVNINVDGSISVNGTASGDTVFILDSNSHMTLEPGKNYAFRGYGTDFDNSFFWQCWTKEPSGVYKDTGSGATFLYTQESEFNFAVLVKSGKTVHATFSPMINEGTIPLPWEPYTGGKPSPIPEYPQEIVSTDVTAVRVKNKNITGPLEYGSVGVDGNEENSNHALRSGFISINPEKSYTFSRKKTFAETNCMGRVYDIDKNFLGSRGILPATTLSKVIKDGFYYTGAKYIRFVQFKGIDETFDGLDLQMEEGDTVTDYEPPIMQTAPISLTEPLHGIGDARDRITCRDGVWGVERYMLGITFDGSEDEQWEIVSTNTNEKKRLRPKSILDFKPVKTNSIVSPGLSNLFGFVSGGGTGTYGANNGISIDDAGNLMVYCEKYNTVNSLSAWKDFLQSNNLIVVAPRATPTWEPLPADTQSALNALTTYTGTTHVTITAGGPEPDVTIGYVQDTRMVIADLQAQIDAIRNGGTT